jgi:uncharacterized membrane protein
LPSGTSGARAYIKGASAYDCLLEPSTTMTESPATTIPPGRLERHFHSASNLAAGCVLLAALLLRLGKASGTFLNLDEAMHFLASNKPTLAEAYRASLDLAHPPLLILLLQVWRRLGTSELLLRLPSVVAGTIFCWIFFRWLTRLLGPVAGWIGFVLVSSLPVFVELSSEIRQYSLLLCFMMAAAYTLELALDESSAGKMSLFFLFLYLAMLTHFSALLFAGVLGAYSLWRLATAHPSGEVPAIWIAGQAAALGLFGLLYRIQISKLQGGASAQHMQLLLANSYFHRGSDHWLRFVFARTFGVLQYTFGQLAVGDIAGLLFVAGIFILLAGREVNKVDAIANTAISRQGPSPRQLALLLTLPFVINASVAILDLYPFGGTRHSAFLIPFAVAGVSLTISRLTRRRLVPTMSVAFFLVAVCQLLGAPHRPYMRREDQRRSNMTQALDAIHRNVASGDVILVDFQTNFLLRFYLCPEASPVALPSADFKTYTCSGHRVIATTSETTVFTAASFPGRWNEMMKVYNLNAGQTVWIFQAGWDIALAEELSKGVSGFRDLNAESFGRNLSLFKLTAEPSMRGSV